MDLSKNKMNKTSIHIEETPPTPNLRKSAAFKGQGELRPTINRDEGCSSSSLISNEMSSAYLRTMYRDRKEVVSNLKNAPSFTIKQKKITYKQVITKEHVQDMLGKETPGVGAYLVDDKIAIQKSPAFPIPTADRFEAVTKFNEYKVSNQLGYYMGTDFKP
jgi:hypothetical protein